MINIKKARQNLHLSQIEASELLKISPQNLSRYELGQTEPNFEILRKMSKLYNCTVDYLVNNDTKGLTIYSEQQKSTITDLCELNDDYLELASKYIKNLLADQVELEKRRKNLIN